MIKTFLPNYCLYSSMLKKEPELMGYHKQDCKSQPPRMERAPFPRIQSSEAVTCPHRPPSFFGAGDSGVTFGKGKMLGRWSDLWKGEGGFRCVTGSTRLVLATHLKTPSAGRCEQSRCINSPLLKTLCNSLAARPHPSFAPPSSINDP